MMMLRRALSVRGPITSRLFTTGVGQENLGAVCTSFSSPPTIKPVPRASLKGEEIRIKVAGGGLNFADVLQAKGQYQVKIEPPFVCGGEVSGEVVELGPNVCNLKVGDKVVALTGTGGFAQECVAQEKTCTKIKSVPKGGCLSQAAAIPCAFGTAHMGLKARANLQPGETVLVTAAAGGVGIATVKLAKAMGAKKVIALAGSDEKLKTCRAEGADHCINYKGLEPKSIREAVKATGEKIDVVVDMVGGQMAEQLIRSLAFNGRFVVIGFASGDIPKIPLNLLLLKNTSATGLFWGSYLQKQPQPLIESLQELLDMWSDGKLTVTADYFQLKDVATAYHNLENRLSTGKVIIKPNA